MTELSHVNKRGEAKMVDISQKADTEREAIARARVVMKPATMKLIKNAAIQKGDVLAVAMVAGIIAAKKTSELIPLCHPILTTSITVDFEFSGDNSVLITTTAKSTGKTGAEMEALVGASVAALTIYDMCKAVDRGMTITDTYLESKQGGKSGVYRRPKTVSR